MAKLMKLLSGFGELLLAIPLLGGAVVLGSGYTVLTFMLVVHIVTLVLSARSREAMYGSVVGIVASLLGSIPLLGWALHLAAGLLLLVSLFQNKADPRGPDGGHYAPPPPPPQNWR
ncbi:hypothetical protein IDH44_09885 [Paenibacillus sp. IB182496]|uniref:Uncharacterized protein n=1 Tax=Paenibacillus sabuli TaxID=2772509 RepID=A0A927BU92_9BACL|nr:hypothetical protein [Paenibacillus sabuli]MBD2845498.1 hypothetical protein [Paenibacillus sabuli]